MQLAKNAFATAMVFDFRRTSADLPRLAARLWLAARVGVWLCVLPLRWRAGGLTAVLERIGPTARPGGSQSSDIEPTVRVVRRVTALRLFTWPIFPRSCLREALALYHVLSQAGQPVEFCVGVMKTGENFIAHSWVTLHGTPILAADRGRGFSVLYSYPRKPLVEPSHDARNTPRFA